MNASDRPNTCKSRGSMKVVILLMATGARVSNGYATCPVEGDNPLKDGLTPHGIGYSHEFPLKFISYRMGMLSISWLVR